jgi:dihydropyrimidinase
MEIDTRNRPAAGSLPQVTELIVANGTVVTAAGSRRADVAIADGRISAVGAGLPAGEARILDAGGLFVLPGVVDVHTHTRLPTVDEPDRFRRDSLAAAHGGTTTFLSFNNPGTGISDDGARSPLAGAAEFRRRTAGQSVVDFGLSSVLSGEQDDPLGELPELINGGVPTAKAFMVYDFRLPDDALERALRIAASHGGMLQVHCEEPAIIDQLVGAALARGDVSCRHHALCRPPEAEAEATRKAIEMARRAEAPIYIVHLSCEGALEAVAEAKARGEPVYAETCPHYLTFTHELYDDPDESQVIRRVISPPLRTARDVEALWAGLRDGILDVVASDHVPDRIAVEKHVPAPPFPQISNGAPGIETLLGVTWSGGVATGRISAERLVNVLATTPARLFGMPGKGAIDVGRDADLVLFDPEAQRILRQEDLHHTSDFTPYEGLPVHGAVREVVIRGRTLAEAATASQGRFLDRRLS